MFTHPKEATNPSVWVYGYSMLSPIQHNTWWFLLQKVAKLPSVQRWWNLDLQRNIFLTTGVGKCPNWTSPKYWGYSLQQMLDSDVKQIPQMGHLPSPKSGFLSLDLFPALRFKIQRSSWIFRKDCKDEKEWHWNLRLHWGDGVGLTTTWTPSSSLTMGMTRMTSKSMGDLQDP